MLIALAPKAWAQSDSAAILAKYEAALASMRRAEYKAHVVTHSKQGNEAEKLHQDMRYTWRCNGNLAKVFMEGKVWNVYSDNDEVYDTKSMLLVDPRNDRSNVTWSSGGEISILMDRQPNEAQRRQVFGVAPFTLLHGYLSLTGVPYLPAVLRKSRLTARADFLGQRQVMLLQGTGPSGRVKLWCDPAVDFWPRKLEWRLAATDVLEDPTGDKPQEKTLARLGLESMVASVDGWDFARVSDQWVPTAFTHQITTTYPEGRGGLAGRSVCTISDISVGPGHLDHPAAFELGSEVPQGTRVHVSSEPQIEYVWQGGRVVKKIDADLSALEGHSVRPPGFPKALIILCAIAGAMVVVLVVVWRRRTARR